MSINIKTPNVQNAFRIKRGNNGNTMSDGPIIIKLGSASDKKSSLSLANAGFKSTTPIFLNEYLTKYNYSILQKAIHFKKQKN